MILVKTDGIMKSIAQSESASLLKLVNELSQLIFYSFLGVCGVLHASPEQQLNKENISPKEIGKPTWNYRPKRYVLHTKMLKYTFFYLQKAKYVRIHSLANLYICPITLSAWCRTVGPYLNRGCDIGSFSIKFCQQKFLVHQMKQLGSHDGMFAWFYVCLSYEFSIWIDRLMVIYCVMCILVIPWFPWFH